MFVLSYLNVLFISSLTYIFAITNYWYSSRNYFVACNLKNWKRVVYYGAVEIKLKEVSILSDWLYLLKLVLFRCNIILCFIVFPCESLLVIGVVVVSELCPALVSDALLMTCRIGTDIVNCSAPALPGTTVSFQCLPGFSEFLDLKRQGEYRKIITCRHTGKWSSNLPICRPGIYLINISSYLVLIRSTVRTFWSIS